MIDRKATACRQCFCQPRRDRTRVIVVDECRKAVLDRGVVAPLSRCTELSVEVSKRGFNTAIAEQESRFPQGRIVNRWHLLRVIQQLLSAGSSPDHLVVLHSSVNRLHQRHFPDLVFVGLLDRTRALSVGDFRRRCLIDVRVLDLQHLVTIVRQFGITEISHLLGCTTTNSTAQQDCINPAN